MTRAIAQNQIKPQPEILPAAIGDTIARLRGGSAEPQTRQRITVEPVQRLSNDRGEGG